MNHAQAKVIASAMPDGRVGHVSPLMRDAMLRRGWLTEREGVLVVTPIARARLIAFTRKSEAHRRAPAPMVYVEGLGLVDMRAPCAECGAQLGSHRNRAPHPLPERKCNAFRRYDA